MEFNLQEEAPRSTLPSRSYSYP